MVGCFAMAFLDPHEIKGFREPSALWRSDDAVPILPVMGRIGAVTPEGRILKLPKAATARVGSAPFRHSVGHNAVATSHRC